MRKLREQETPLQHTEGRETFLHMGAEGRGLGPELRHKTENDRDGADGARAVASRWGRPPSQLGRYPPGSGYASGSNSSERE